MGAEDEEKAVAVFTGRGNTGGLHFNPAPVHEDSSKSSATTAQAARCQELCLTRAIVAIAVRYFKASAPPTISAISLVMAAWRARLRVRVRPEIILPALSVALDMEVMRAPCSEAMLSMMA